MRRARKFCKFSAAVRLSPSQFRHNFWWAKLNCFSFCKFMADGPVSRILCRRHP
jgi:hypothetical protein